IAGTTRRLRIAFHTKAVTGTVAGDAFTLRIKEGATVLQEENYLVPGTSQQLAIDFEAIVDSPTAASHTYKVTIQPASGTGTATVGGRAAGPITITVQDVGQV